MSYKEIKAEDLAWNPFTQIGKGGSSSPPETARVPMP